MPSKKTLLIVIGFVIGIVGIAAAIITVFVSKSGNRLNVLTTTNYMRTSSPISSTNATAIASTSDPASHMYYGVQHSLYPSSLSNIWSLCHKSTYAMPMNETVITDLLSLCNQSKLLLGCRATNTTRLVVAAMANRTDVIYECGSIANCSHAANGVKWYFSKTWSWGFLRVEEETTQRNPCDTEITNSYHRMCWDTLNGFGYRCGAYLPPESERILYERVVYHAN